MQDRHVFFLLPFFCASCEERDVSCSILERLAHHVIRLAMRHLHSKVTFVRSLLSSLQDGSLTQQFSTSSAACKRSKKLWPSGGSWEYAIADYKLRKEGSRPFSCPHPTFLRKEASKQCNRPHNSICPFVTFTGAQHGSKLPYRSFIE